MNFKGFPLVNWESVLSRSFVEIQCLDDKKMLLKRLGNNLFFRRPNFEFKKANNQKLLCFQSYYERKSYRDQMEKFSNLEKMDLIQADSLQKRKFVGFRFLFFRLLPWYLELRKLEQPLWVKIKLLGNLITIWSVKEFFEKIDIKRYSLLVTFCDSNIEQAYVAELFKINGIKTVTLQHGQFTAFREPKLVNSGVEIRTLKSDYFLVWNQMTIDECKKQGVNNVNLIICGILGYIGGEYKSCINPHNKMFGVVINHQFFEKENLELISCANKLAREAGYKYYLKLHPNYDENYFSQYVDKDFYVGNIQKGIPILEYANMCEFSIVSSSSVFCELVYARHNVLRYSTKKIDDKFKDVPYGLTFSSWDDVVISYNKGFNKEENESLFRYLCGTEDVTNSYKMFLNKIL